MTIIGQLIGHDLNLIALMIFETFCAFIVRPLNLASPISAEVSFSQFSVLFLQDMTFTTAEMKSAFRLAEGKSDPYLSG